MSVNHLGVDALTEILARDNERAATVDAELASLSNLKADLAAITPVAPNWIADTYLFADLCGGAVGVETEIIAAHGGVWGGSILDSTPATGTMKVITLSDLAAEGIAHGGALSEAINPDHLGNGDTFHVLIMDVAINGPQAGGSAGRLDVLRQGGIALNYGMVTEHETGMFVNVISQAGDTVFLPNRAHQDTHIVDGTAAGQGWLYTHWGRNKRTRSTFNPGFEGTGSMKIAIALPYFATGDHQGKPVWAGYVGDYAAGDVS